MREKRFWFVSSAAFFILWGFCLFLNPRLSLFSESHVQYYTLQVEAWLAGRFDIVGDHGMLWEFATYKGQRFVSFPPTPSLIELPFHVLTGGLVPNHWPPVLCLFTSFLLMVKTLREKTGRDWFASLSSLFLIFAGNMANSLAQGGVWHFAQVEGFSFATMAICLSVLGSREAGFLRKAAPYLLLSLAVGCRPFYLFYLPLVVILNVRLSKRDWKDVIWTGPYLFILAAYNYARFDSIFEFGHNYLPIHADPNVSQFGTKYFLRNVWHVFVKIPQLANHEWSVVQFDPVGNAFYINNPIVLFGFVLLILALIRRSPPVVVFGAAFFTVLTVWLPLLLHQSNGWTQFGYRYIIDLSPLAFLAFVFSPFKIPVLLLTVVGVLGLVVNAYGIVWFSAFF